MRSEFDRVQKCFPIETMNNKCFEISEPPIVKCIDMSAWQERLENLNSQLEHHATKYILMNMYIVMVSLQNNIILIAYCRIRNLNYIKYGAETWKTYAEILLKLIDGIQAKVTDLKYV